MLKPQGPLETPILHRLSPDEFTLIAHYRASNQTHQQNIRLFAYTASALTTEADPAAPIPFIVK